MKWEKKPGQRKSVELIILASLRSSFSIKKVYLNITFVPTKQQK